MVYCLKTVGPRIAEEGIKMSQLSWSLLSSKAEKKFLLWRSSYKTLAIQELLRHVVTSCWIAHLKSPISLERCAVGLPPYHAYKGTT